MLYTLHSWRYSIKVQLDLFNKYEYGASFKISTSLSNCNVPCMFALSTIKDRMYYYIYQLEVITTSYSHVGSSFVLKRNLVCRTNYICVLWLILDLHFFLLNWIHRSKWDFFICCTLKNFFNVLPALLFCCCPYCSCLQFLL